MSAPFSVEEWWEFTHFFKKKVVKLEIHFENYYGMKITVETCFQNNDRCYISSA